MADRKIITLRELYKKASAATTKEDLPVLDAESTMVRGMFEAEVVPAADEERTITFIVRSSGAADRNAYATNPEGWHVEAYQKNPVFLWSHDTSRLPVGKTIQTWTEAGQLRIKVEFTPKGMSKFNDLVFDMYQQGYLHGVSAGWIPIDYEWVETESGWEIAFNEQELLEVSGVTVPADSGALRLAAGYGLDVSPLRQWASNLLGEPRFIMHTDAKIDKQMIEHISNRFSEFYPSAKLLILPAGTDIKPFDASTEKITALEPKDIELDISLDIDEETFVEAVAEFTTTTTEISDEVTSDLVDDDPSPEGEYRGSREWRIRRLALLET